MRVYISGKITGLSEQEYTKNFKKAQARMEMMGHEVLNPVEQTKAIQNVTPWKMTYEEMMGHCLIALGSCDAIYLMKNWRDSPGAKYEKDTAVAQGKEIIAETDEE